MPEIFNYQWPQCFIKKVKFINYSNGKTNKIKKEIEEFFSKKLFSNAVLFPSARSCVGAIIEFNKLGRKNEVYVNKWVSNCLFNTIGFYSNPTINLNDPDEECDLNYVVNYSKKKDINYAMSNTFGFGGHNGVLIFKRFSK